MCRPHSLYHQEGFYAHAGLAIPRSTLAQGDAIGRNNWLFAGSMRAGQRAAVAMSLVQSALMNWHDPDLYLKELLTRLPMHRASRIEELLPHRRQAANS